MSYTLTFYLVTLIRYYNGIKCKRNATLHVVVVYNFLFNDFTLLNSYVLFKRHDLCALFEINTITFSTRECLR